MGWGGHTRTSPRENPWEPLGLTTLLFPKNLALLTAQRDEGFAWEPQRVWRAEGTSGQDDGGRRICSRPNMMWGSTRPRLRFSFPSYRTACSQRSRYCTCLLSHMEAARLRECLGNITPGTDHLGSSSFFLSHRFCCHPHLVPGSCSLGSRCFPSAFGYVLHGVGRLCRHFLRLVGIRECFVEPVLPSGHLRGSVAPNNSAPPVRKIHFMPADKGEITPL